MPVWVGWGGVGWGGVGWGGVGWGGVGWGGEWGGVGWGPLNASHPPPPLEGLDSSLVRTSIFA